MAVKELYRRTNGGEHGMSVVFDVDQASSPMHAVNLLRAYLTSDTSNGWIPDLDPETAWTAPPTDPDRNEKLQLIAIRAEPIHDARPLNDNTTQPFQDLFRCTAEYGHRASCPVVTYDHQSTNQRIYQSLNTREEWTEGSEDPRDFQGAIEVDISGNSLRVQGTTKLVPAARFSLLWHPPPSFVAKLRETDPSAGEFAEMYYQRYIYRQIGKTNGTSFLEWPPDTVLFTGFQMKEIDVKNHVYEMSYSFQGGSVLGPRTIHGINVGDTFPWEHVWALREPDVGVTTPGSKKYPLPKIIQINAEQIAEKTPFNDFFYESTNFWGGDSDSVPSFAGGVFHCQNCRGFMKQFPVHP